jgi:hypothetical protein
MAFFSSTQRFAFAADGTMTDGRGDMVVTYRGPISPIQAQDDAFRRFKQWQSLSSSLSRLRSADQLVVV